MAKVRVAVNELCKALTALPAVGDCKSIEISSILLVIIIISIIIKVRI
jgi:hypothetical protein